MTISISTGPEEGHVALSQSNLRWTKSAEWSQSVPAVVFVSHQVEQARGELIRELEGRLNRVQEEVHDNWDGEGAMAPDDGAVKLALYTWEQLVDSFQRLPALPLIPSLTPLLDGGVRMEWVRGGEEFWIDATPDEGAMGFYIDESRENYWEGPLEQIPFWPTQLIFDIA